MIITKLIGGLGNQMLQYAFGRWVSFFNKTNLKLDITGYENQEVVTQRKYNLFIFNIKEQFASKDEINKIKRLNYNKYLLKIINRILPYYYRPHVVQKYFEYDSNVKKIKNNSYLEGYWFSEKYFKGIEDVIRKDFTFKYGPNEINKKFIYEIINSNSISIHVRRGDYVTDKKTTEFHGTCDLEYYNQAVLFVSKKISNPHFFIFSDDSDWVKKNLCLNYQSTFVIHNFKKNNYEDLRLMSMCKHSIISNSSFSWWGAWLNYYPNKIVIAPKKWFNNQEISAKDIIPDYWIKM